jgi:hypothetical protein
MKNNTETWHIIKNKLLKTYKSLEEAFIDLLPGWKPPICQLCNNKLPNIGTLTIEDGEYIYHPHTHICCLLSDCPSFKIKKRTDEYRNKVLGKSLEEIKLSNKIRLQRVVESARRNGVYLPENNPMSKNKLRDRGMTEEEISKFGSDRALKAIETKREAGWYDDISNNVYSREYHLKKGLTEEETDQFIRSKNHNCKEFWVKRGYSEEEATEKSKKSADTISLTAKIDRYGEELGKIKYTETIENLSNGWNPVCAGHFNFGTSQAASDFFDEIKNNIPYKCYYKSKTNSEINKEWYISIPKAIYFYDFTIIDLKLIIEFNGEHVHPRKDKLTEEQFLNWKHAFTKVSGVETYEKDQNKMYAATNLGYNILILWSRDPFEYNLKTALNFIKEHSDGKFQDTQS